MVHYVKLEQLLNVWFIVKLEQLFKVLFDHSLPMSDKLISKQHIVNCKRDNEERQTMN